MQQFDWKLTEGTVQLMYLQLPESPGTLYNLYNTDHTHTHTHTHIYIIIYIYYLNALLLN